jgi:cytochrome c-type biogenesis protein CcsB
VTNTQWEQLSVQAIAVVAVVYFLAFLAHLVEWAALRRTEAKVPVAAGGVDLADVPAEGDDEQRLQRAAVFGRFGVLLTVLGAAVQLVGLVGRGMAADPNRVPWGNMYEFVLTGTWVVVVLYLLLFRKYSLAWLAPVVTGFTISVLMLAQLSLYEEVAPLTEALSSPWLVIHVVAAIIATGAFTLGGMASILYLVKERVGEGSGNGFIARMPSPQALDRLSYRLHAFGFPVWTFAVLIAGPIWAHYAWSRYWGWDAKEVWAFITWVVYAAYLHARATAGWKGRNAALIAIVGLATLWFNFIGINFFFGGSSQHSYAAPASPVVAAVAEPVPAQASSS